MVYRKMAQKKPGIPFYGYFQTIIERGHCYTVPRKYYGHTAKDKKSNDLGTRKQRQCADSHRETLDVEDACRGEAGG